MQKLTAVVLTMIFLITGCADFDACIKKEPLSHGISKVLIGNFEYRNISYEPYIVPSFKEALGFEFFKKGIIAGFVGQQDEVPDNDNQQIAALMKKMSGDILIKGVISQRESGFLTDREISSYVSFVIYNKQGSVIGQGLYKDNKSAGDDSFQKYAAAKISSVIINKLNKQ